MRPHGPLSTLTHSLLLQAPARRPAALYPARPIPQWLPVGAPDSTGSAAAGCQARDERLAGLAAGGAAEEGEQQLLRAEAGGSGRGGLLGARIPVSRSSTQVPVLALVG